MNYSKLARLPEHPGMWGHESTVQTGNEAVGATEETEGNAEKAALTEKDIMAMKEAQLWQTLTHMTKRQDQWVTIIGRPPRALLEQMMATGLNPKQIRIIHTHDHEKALWATEQALLLDNSQLIISWLGQCSVRETRRLELASKACKAPNFLFTQVSTTPHLH